jgi:SAM-dependent methyltransferase
MAKNDEINYLKNIGPDGMAHAANKPFSDPECGNYLVDLGFIMSLLPPPPLKLLDLGCGTGWTSVFFARRGYQVTAQDISGDMIHLANRNKEKAGIENAAFIESDFESLDFKNEFDCAVFYDSLHHSEDANMALKKIYAALKPGGVCVTCEPGKGHAKQSGQVVEKFRTTEKDMPPTCIIKIGKAVGFRTFRVYPRLMLLGRALYKTTRNPLINALLEIGLVRQLAVLRRMWCKQINGVVVMVK